MKKIVASVGMVALGATGVQAASDVSSPEPVKPWSISASLRGFYDDNINSAPAASIKQDSFGFEVSPSLSWKETWEQTTLSLGYVYSLHYYDNKPAGNTDSYDQNHNFNAAFTHAFTERYDLSVTDNFVIGQEPDTLRAGNAFNSFYRVPGNNILNYGAINFNAQLTKLFGAQLGYANTYVDYENTGATGNIDTGLVIPSNAGPLNRLEHVIHLDGRWQLQRQTIGIVGYQYRETDYTANEVIAGPFPSQGGPPTNFSSDNRNSRMHYGYVGADHNFRPDLTASVRVGASLSDYYNDPTQDSQISPYAMLNLRYTYGPESFLEAGFSYDRIATDLIGFNGPSLTTDAQSAVLYATWNHRITPRLFSNVIAQFQDNTYNNGQYNSESDRFYLLGLNLEYRLNPHLSFNVGYNYDRLDSDISIPVPRSFDRNRVYMGIVASY